MWDYNPKNKLKENINCKITDYRLLKKFTDLSFHSSGCRDKETKVHTNNEIHPRLLFIQPPHAIKLGNARGAFVLKKNKDVNKD